MIFRNKFKQMVMSGIGFAALSFMTVKEELESGKHITVRYSGEFSPIYSQMLIKDKNGCSLRWKLSRILY